jgi:amino acid transporter
MCVCALNFSQLTTYLSLGLAGEFCKYTNKLFKQAEIKKRLRRLGVVPFSRLVSAATLIDVIFSLILLTVGSVLFYSGVLGSFYNVGTIQLVPFLVLVGGVLIAFGIFVAVRLGKKLKGTSLATISLVYLIGATLIILLMFSTLNFLQILAFLPPLYLSDAILDVAFLVGYSEKESTKGSQ